MAETAETSIPPTKEKLDELVKSAGLQYSLKNFAGAAELYSKATEIQGQLNGEMAPENAELLYYYGRALYKVAIATSDVLGNKVAQEEKKKPKAGKQAKAESSGAAASGAKTEAKGETVESKPYFQLTGDENWTDSEDEEEDAEAEGAAEGEEEQDDFGNAFEAFDIARVLYTKQLEGLDAHDGVSKGKGKAEISPRSKLVRERLADCYNYLVDIAFENENFHSAVADARSALEIQQEFLDISHQYITEAHYKLSLALEFASVSKVREEQAGMQVGDSDKAKESEAEIDYELRKEAAQQMELAIQSLESRIKKEQAEASNLPKDKKKEKESSIKDGQEMLEDMKTRVSLLHGTAPPSKFHTNAS